MLSSIRLTDGTVGLRPFLPEDSKQLYEAVHESLFDLKPWMGWAHDAYSLSEAEDFIKITQTRWEQRNLFAFAIMDAETGSILGGVSLSHFHPVYHLCNLGYWVRSSRHGEGIAGRSAKLAARYGIRTEFDYPCRDCDRAGK